MDDKFKSSFIPKTPLVGREEISSRKPSKKSAPFLFISAAVFLLSLLSIGAVYGYKTIIQGDIESMEAQLEESRQQFEPAEIARYKRLDNRLSVALDLLENHRVTFPVFDLLSEITMASVQFTSFSFAVETIEPEPVETVPEIDPETGEPIVVPPPEPETNYTLSLSGVADSFETVALQADQFEENELITSSTLSGLSLGENDTVTFDISATIDPELISYVAQLTQDTEVEVEVTGSDEELVPADTEEGGSIESEVDTATAASSASEDEEGEPTEESTLSEEPPLEQ